MNQLIQAVAMLRRKRIFLCRIMFQLSLFTAKLVLLLYVSTGVWAKGEASVGSPYSSSWGALVLLIMPTKYVKLELMMAASSSLVANFEEMLDITAFNGKGTYLPPNLLRDYQSSLVFIPVDSGETLPKPEDIPEDKSHRSSAGLFLIPPGLALSKLFERKLGKSFTEVNLDQLARELPKLFEELEITKSTLVTVEGSSIIVEARNHVFNDLCEQTRKLHRTHEAVGCPFSSAIACALSKAAGKPVTLEKEEQSPDGKTTTIQYRILEE